MFSKYVSTGFQLLKVGVNQANVTSINEVAIPKKMICMDMCSGQGRCSTCHFSSERMKLICTINRIAINKKIISSTFFE